MIPQSARPLFASVSPGARALGSCALRGIIAVAALYAAASAEDPSVILRGMDNLEKRISKIEAETGKLRRVQAAPAAASDRNSAHADSAVLRLSGRLDSLLLRLVSLETEAKAAAAHSAKASAERAADSAQDEDAGAGASASTVPAQANAAPDAAGLALEIRALTALLKEERAALAANGSASKQGVPAKPSLAAAANGQALSGPAPAAAAPAPSGLPAALELKGDIQIQGERKFSAQSKRDNLDDFWGRLNFGAEYNQGDFQSKLNIRIFPEGFGFEPLTGATFDTAGQGSLKTQTAPSSRIVINHAWAKYALGIAKLKIGRFETVETQSDNFGNYVDLGASGRFMSRPAVHNAMETSLPLGPIASSIMLATNDRKLNRGFLRVYEKYSPIPDLALSAGYRANIFDRFQYPDDEVLQRFDAGAAWKSPIGWRAFVEAAVLENAGRGNDMPVLIGLQPKIGTFLDLLSLEAEWLTDRKAAGENKELFFNVHARKALGRFKLDAGCYSDPSDADWNAVSLGLRMTSNIK
jgi:hypothetical protein